MVAFWSGPAWAWGHWMHALVAERSLAVLLPRHPELLASQDAWWLAAWSIHLLDLQAARQAHREVREPDFSAAPPRSSYQKTFVRAWVMHRDLDTDMTCFVAGLPAFDGVDGRRNDLLVGLISDAQLSALAYEVALSQSRLVYRALHSPDGTAWATWFAALVNINAGNFLQAARYDWWLLSQGTDTALNGRARNLGAERDATWLRGPAARQLTGDLMPWAVSLSARAVKAYERGQPPNRAKRTNVPQTLSGE